MPEPDAPTAPATETVETPKSPLRTDVPLTRQTTNILKLAQEEKPEDKKDEKQEEKPKEEEVPKPEFLPEDYPDDEEERPAPAPIEAKTWQEYVSKNVQPIQVVGRVGEEEKVFTVFTEDQLPKKFEFTSEIERLKTLRAFDRLERQAERLRDDFFQKEQEAKFHEFEVQEAKDVASDLKWLQSRGIAPKFQYEEDDPRFNSDPAVKEVNEIYNLYKKVNNDYAQRFVGTNRSYRISFRDAADKYYAARSRQSARAPKEEKPVEKTPLEKDRDNISRKTKSPQGGDAHTAKPRAYKGMTFADVNRLFKAGKI